MPPWQGRSSSGGREGDAADTSGAELPQERPAERFGLSLMTVHFIMTKDRPSAEAEHVYALALALEMRPSNLSQTLAAAPTLGQREMLESAGTLLTH